VAGTVQHILRAECSTDIQLFVRHPPSMFHLIIINRLY